MEEKTRPARAIQEFGKPSLNYASDRACLLTRNEARCIQIRQDVLFRHGGAETLL